MNMTLNKTFQIKEFRALDLRISANNIFNIVHFTSINTAVNSFTFREVTGTSGMRRVTMQARFRFWRKTNMRVPRKTISVRHAPGLALKTAPQLAQQTAKLRGTETR